MNKWFKVFPYAGWIVICMASLIACITIYWLEQHRYSEKNMVRYIQEDFANREYIVAHDRSAGLFQNLQSDSLSGKLPESYFLFTSEDAKVTSWTSSAIDLPQRALNHPDSFLNGRFCKSGNGYFYLQSWLLSPDSATRQYAYTLIPVYYDYWIENEYFKSYFVANAFIPLSSILSAQDEPGDYSVLTQNGKPAFFIHFNGNPKDLYQVGYIVWILAIITCFSLCFWIHEFCYGISKRKFYKGWLLLLSFITLVQLILFNTSLPLGFANTPLFSPEIFSSGEEVSSLGNLLIYVLLYTWLFIYSLRDTPIAWNRLFHLRFADIAARTVLSLLLLFLLVKYNSDYVGKLILDSKISFEAGDFTHITIYTFAGILIIALITINFLFILALVCRLFGSRMPVVLRYLLLISAVIFLEYWFPSALNLAAIITMVVVGMFLIDMLGLPLPSGFRHKLVLTPTSYIWFAVLCAWITSIIFYFNYAKEKELRKIYAEKQHSDKKSMVYYFFDNIVEDVNGDPEIRAFMRQGNSGIFPLMEQYIYYTYLTDYISQYAVSLFFYDKNRTPIDSRDTLLLKTADSIGGKKFNGGIISLAGLQNVDALWGLCPVTGKGKDTLGYIGLYAILDNRPKQTNQRSFFQKKYNPTDQQYFDKYAYGLYRNNILYEQGGNDVFPFKGNWSASKEFAFTESLRSSLLSYRISATEYIQVMYRRNIATALVSLFSYVLAVLLLLSASTFLLRYLLFYPLKVRLFFRTMNPSIRSRVNLTISLTVLFSLLVVGIITISFLNDRYKENQRKNLRNLVYFFTENIKDFIRDEYNDFNKAADTFRSVYTSLSFQLNELAEEQDAEVNVYSNEGKLIATSQMGLLRNGLLSHYMSPLVLQMMTKGGQSEIIINEEIGALKYQSIYTALRDKEGKIIAYINLPYYASYTEFQDEISNVLVALINVYTLVFFLSGIFAVLISNSIVRSFRLLIDQFRNIQLTRNEAIHWPYKDEISILVKEYNTMMQKVEDMAKRLARTEREEAWREIAKQVAHEIKNPLTPMKLSIQYLQQAIQSGRADITDLASRVSLTLIEQIENLSVIASEFSNFAKMPEAYPEKIHLYEMLYSVTQLFQNNGNSTVVLVEQLPDLCIYMDKSYFIRIFNNIISNAIQAVPEDRLPVVRVNYEQKNDRVVISVEDNGSGIPEELKANLFVPYFTTKSSGTGLGLSMTKKMIEHANGSIRFETVAGEGTVFYISFPVMKGEPGSEVQRWKPD